MVYKTIYDLSGNSVKATEFINEAGVVIAELVEDKTEIVALDADAEEAHALNATFSDTEVEAALDALGAKINEIITALKA